MTSEKFTIVPITEEYVQEYNLVVDKVARERKYLSFLVGPSLEMSLDFVKENIEGNWHITNLFDISCISD